MSVQSTGLSKEEKKGAQRLGTKPFGRTGIPAHLDVVRTVAETAVLLGLGEQTLRTMIKEGRGPQVTRLSARRIGIRDSHRQFWLKTLEAAV
jgi:hypothetical protein